MDIIVLLFIIILIIIDSNIRNRMFAVLSAAVSLRHSINTQSDSDVDDNDTDNDTDDDTTITVSQDAIEAVARLVAATNISATRACHIAFNVSARGNTAIYKAVRKRAAALKQQSTNDDEIVDIRKDGRVIRRDSNDKYYVVHSDGSKEFISEKEITK